MKRHFKMEQKQFPRLSAAQVCSSVVAEQISTDAPVLSQLQEINSCLAQSFSCTPHVCVFAFRDLHSSLQINH